MYRVGGPCAVAMAWVMAAVGFCALTALCLTAVYWRQVEPVLAALAGLCVGGLGVWWFMARQLEEVYRRGWNDRECWRWDDSPGLPR